MEYSGVRSPLEYRIPLGGKGLSILVFFGGLITSQGGTRGAHCNTIDMVHRRQVMVDWRIQERPNRVLGAPVLEVYCVVMEPMMFLNNGNFLIAGVLELLPLSFVCTIPFHCVLGTRLCKINTKYVCQNPMSY